MSELDQIKALLDEILERSPQLQSRDLCQSFARKCKAILYPGQSA